MIINVDVNQLVREKTDLFFSLAHIKTSWEDLFILTDDMRFYPKSEKINKIVYSRVGNLRNGPFL